MGKWTIEHIDVNWADRDADNLFGHDVHVRFRLRYRPALVGWFADTPRLVWYEQITLKDHAQQTYWAFETNMYELRPFSRTLEVWPKRYIDAYQQAAGTAALPRGSAQLLDRNHLPVPLDALGGVGGTPGEQAAAVRNYLKRHGDILLIEVHDIPSLGLVGADGAIVNKERLLLFTFGVEGGDVWLRASQYLRCNTAAERSMWTRQFAPEALEHGRVRPSWTKKSQYWVDGFTTGTFVKADPPGHVTTPGVAIAVAGEYP